MRLTILASLLFAGSCLAGEVVTPNGPVNITEYKVSKAAPTVIIASGCTGVSNFYNYSAWGLVVQSWGYNAVVVDSFAPRGYPRGVCGTNNINPSMRVYDIDAVAKWVRQQAYHQGDVAMIGFSHGGSTALNLASNPEITSIKSVVALYPNCKSRFVGRDYSNPHLPGLVLLAQDDRWTPISNCQTEKFPTHIYPGVGHSFDADLPDRTVHGQDLKYNKSAHMDALDKTKRFLKQTIGE
jgi:dienelactone hydrolase